MLALWQYFWNTWPATPQSLSASITIGTSTLKQYSLQATGSAVASNPSLAVPTAPTSISLPVSPTTFVYIRNVGKFPVQITWTPFGGISAVVETLQPGGFTAHGDQSLGSGITALSVQAIGGASVVDYTLFG